MAAAATSPIVTDHAVTRYLQRALGIVVDVDELDFGNHFCMQLHLYAANLTRRDVEGMLLTPIVCAAIWGGARKIRTAEGVLVIKNAAVITIEPLNLKLPPKRFRKNMSRKEARRGLRQQQTRKRRRPVNA